MSTALLLLLACRQPNLDDAPTGDAFELGEDDGIGNVVAIQAWMDPSAYASETNFDGRLREFMEGAQARGWLNDKTIVVLPEHIATWLIVVNEANSVYTADTAEQALKRMVPGNLARFLELQQDAPAEDPYQYALFALKAEEIADIWLRVAQGIAMDYKVTLVAGSAWLPGPVLVDNRISVREGEPMRNVSFTVDRHGQILGDLVLKAFPSSGEQDLVEPGATADIGTTPTAVGEVAVLLDEDAWYPDAWAKVKGKKPVVAINPYWINPVGAWHDLWGGYSGYDAPRGVSREDEMEMIYADAVLEYGMPARQFSEGVVREGVMVPLRGELWDLGTDGPIVGVYRKEATVGPLVNAPVLLNLWLPKR